MEKHIPYRAYLVRIWQTKRGGQEGYRAMAENVATRERRHFPDLESLFAFLRAQGGESGQKDSEDASDGCDGEFSS